MSLCQGVFAKNWKIALVKQVLKKVGLDLNHSNYRPVSNLLFLSKVVETCMLKQSNKHSTDNHLFPDYQSAYRQNYSCKTALVKLVNDILRSMEWQCITALAAIDLLAAFDTVDHTILLKVLQNKFSITDAALEWFRPYLWERGCKVNIGDHRSMVKNSHIQSHKAVVVAPPYTQYRQAQYKKSFHMTTILVPT